MANNGILPAQVLVAETPDVAIAKLQVTQADHERRISKLEGVVWKVLFAALGGAVAGGSAAVVVARVLASHFGG